MRKIGRAVFAALLCAGCVCVCVCGCASDLVNIAPRPPENFQKLGQAKGSACGSLLIDGFWWWPQLATWNFIPIGLNSRVERAYQEAVSSVSGATGLINVTMEERWYWWVIGNARCVTVTGEAVR